MRDLGLVDPDEYEGHKRAKRREDYMQSGAMGLDDIKAALETERRKTINCSRLTYGI